MKFIYWLFDTETYTMHKTLISHRIHQIGTTLIAPDGLEYRIVETYMAQYDEKFAKESEEIWV